MARIRRQGKPSIIRPFGTEYIDLTSGKIYVQKALPRGNDWGELDIDTAVADDVKNGPKLYITTSFITPDIKDDVQANGLTMVELESNQHIIPINISVRTINLNDDSDSVYRGDLNIYYGYFYDNNIGSFADMSDAFENYLGNNSLSTFIFNLSLPALFIGMSNKIVVKPSIIQNVTSTIYFEIIFTYQIVSFN